MIQDFPTHLPTPTSSFFVSFSTGQLRVLFIHVLGHLQETQPLQDEQKKPKNCIANIYHSKQNVHMVPEMGGFPKTFRGTVAALFYKSRSYTFGSVIKSTFLLTELFVHRHVFDSFCVERNAAVFKITSFAIACVLSCRLIVDAATPCGTGSFMVLLHCFELFGMKIFMTGTNCCHQHQRKEHHSHHDHWVAVGTTEVQNMAGHARHLITSNSAMFIHQNHNHDSSHIHADTQRSNKKYCCPWEDTPAVVSLRCSYLTPCDPYSSRNLTGIFPL